MTDQRPPPQNTVQLAGRAASDVINGLKHHPVLLAMIMLNIIGIGAGLWVLNRLADNAAANVAGMQQLLKDCLPRRGSTP